MYKVMIVEDETALHFIYKTMKVWSECGFVVAATESDGRAALEHLKKEKFDLIFTDIRMPFVDGIELLKTIKASGDPTPVIFASSFGEFEYAQQGITYGVFDYLIKPVDEKKLGEVLERVKVLIDQNNSTKLSPIVEDLLDELHADADNDEFVRHIATYCTEHYTDDLTADELSGEMGFRKDYFGKLFRQHFGVTYSDFRSRIKFAFAAELLSTGNYKAYEVSDMLGFPSYKYFSEKFKKVMGAAPADYKFSPRGKKE